MKFNLKKLKYQFSYQMSFEEPLRVEMIHLYETENATSHRTENFELVHMESPTPVLRRGQVFNMAIRFNRDYIDDTDIVRIIFNFGPSPNVIRGTRGINTVTNNDMFNSELEAWGVRMVGANGNDLSVEVKSPIDSPVGIWQLKIETTMVQWNFEPTVYDYDKDVWLLFNPWMKGENNEKVQ